MKLSAGDKVAFIAPSSFIDRKSLSDALHWFEQQKIAVELMPHVFDRQRYLAGSDTDRAADVNACFARSDIKAVFCVRGGAGSAKMLDLLDYDLIKNNPKPVFGLSDSTALQNALYAQAGVISYSGFLPVFDFKYSVLNKIIEQDLKAIFNAEKYQIKSGQTVGKGQAEGVVIGGCLSVFCGLCGTKFFPDLKNKILLLEDVGEKTYKIEMMLNQLRLQKGFSQIAGLIFGQFKNCLAADVEDGSVDDILTDFVGGLNVPVVKNFAYGHETERHIMPIGGKIRLNADQCLVDIL